MSQIKPLHTISCYLFKVYFNIILPSTSRSYKSSISLTFSSKKTLYYAAMILFTRFYILLETFGEKIYVLEIMKIKKQCIQK